MKTPRQTFNMRLRPADNERLDALVAHYGIGVCSVMRMLIERDARQLERKQKSKSSATTV